ncbi:MAG: neutral zinc metallopeptidase [Nocardioides sp.]|jgi:predicted metalloprotease
MRFNPKARLDTSRVGDDGGRGGPGGGGMRLPIPGGTTAGGGIGGLLVLLLLFVLFQCMGGLPGQPSGQDQGTQSGNDTSRVSDPDRYANCKTGADAQQDVDCARIAVENSLYNFWKTDFEGDNAQFQPAKMQTFSGAVNTACGQATSQVGPFYCPGDQTIYLDTTFFDQVLEQQLGGPDGGFVEPYVIGHEYGHHIQNLAGIMNKVRTQKGPNSDAVKLELQADCFAGAWTAGATETEDATGKVAIFTQITEQDIQEAIAAAEAVGDDRIQEKTQGRVTPENWTHGSAKQRVESFNIGFKQGVDACVPVGP